MVTVGEVQVGVSQYTCLGYESMPVNTLPMED